MCAVWQVVYGVGCCCRGGWHCAVVTLVDARRCPTRGVCGGHKLASARERPALLLLLQAVSWRGVGWVQMSVQGVAIGVSAVGQPPPPMLQCPQKCHLPNHQTTPEARRPHLPPAAGGPIPKSLVRKSGVPCPAVPDLPNCQPSNSLLGTHAAKGPPCLWWVRGDGKRRV